LKDAFSDEEVANWGVSRPVGKDHTRSKGRGEKKKLKTGSLPGQDPNDRRRGQTEKPKQKPSGESGRFLKTGATLLGVKPVKISKRELRGGGLDQPETKRERHFQVSWKGDGKNAWGPGGEEKEASPDPRIKRNCQKSTL